MKLQRRLLAEICTEINEVAQAVHTLWRRREDWEDVLDQLQAHERRLDVLYAEKRWLLAGGLNIPKEAAEMERRIRMSVHKYRYSRA